MTFFLLIFGVKFQYLAASWVLAALVLNPGRNIAGSSRSNHAHGLSGRTVPFAESKKRPTNHGGQHDQEGCLIFAVVRAFAAASANAQSLGFAMVGTSAVWNELELASAAASGCEFTADPRLPEPVYGKRVLPGLALIVPRLRQVSP
jgi:hypothetical protein